MHRTGLAVLAAVVVTISACGSADSTSDTLAEPGVTDTDPPSTEAPPSTTPITSGPPSTDAPIELPTTDPSVDAGTQARLDAARSLWSAQGPAAYTMVTQELCFCPESVWSQTIVDGEVTEHVPVTEIDPIISFRPPAHTMESLFDQIQKAIDSGAIRVDFTTDDTTGAIVEFFVDQEEMVADEEYGVAVISLDPAT